MGKMQYLVQHAQYRKSFVKLNDEKNWEGFEADSRKVVTNGIAIESLSRLAICNLLWKLVR